MINRGSVHLHQYQNSTYAPVSFLEADKSQVSHKLNISCIEKFIINLKQCDLKQNYEYGNRLCYKNLKHHKLQIHKTLVHLKYTIDIEKSVDILNMIL